MSSYLLAILDDLDLVLKGVTFFMFLVMLALMWLAINDTSEDRIHPLWSAMYCMTLFVLLIIATALCPSRRDYLWMLESQEIKEVPVQIEDEGSNVEPLNWDGSCDVGEGNGACGPDEELEGAVRALEEHREAHDE